MGFVNSILKVFGLAEEEELEAVEETPKRAKGSPYQVVPFGVPEVEFYVMKPSYSEDKKRIFDIESYSKVLKERKALLLDLNLLFRVYPEEASRIVDFLAGVTVAIEGTTKEISDNIFLFAPPSYKIRGDDVKDFRRIEF